MEFTDIKDLADHIINKLNLETVEAQRKDSSDGRLVLLVYGEPGSGKTTYTEQLVQYLNKQPHVGTNNHVTVHESPIEIYQGKGGSQTQICRYLNDTDIVMETIPFAIHLKMDGFHLPLSLLSPELKQRRGCEESFDSSLVVKLVELLVNDNGKDNDDSNAWSYLSIPDFDHSIKDPTNPGTYVSRQTKIVILEGLYLMLDRYPWLKIPKIVESMRENPTGCKHSIQIAHIIGGSEEETAFRVGMRHLKAGLVSTYDEGRQRYFLNDKNNADLVREHSITKFDDWIINNSNRLL